MVSQASKVRKAPNLGPFCFKAFKNGDYAA